MKVMTEGGPGRIPIGAQLHLVDGRLQMDGSDGGGLHPLTIVLAEPPGALAKGGWMLVGIEGNEIVLLEADA